jgi:NADH dehydrogenase FAD-containing subunit
MSEDNQKIKDAKSVLCVGAGSTGIEMAGYLKDSFPDKKVGICQRGNILLP